VLITGSTKGVGLALAEQHLQEGDNVIICSRTEESVRAVMRDLRDRYGSDRVSGQACNVCKGSDVASLIKRAQDDLGSIDLWINNAGTNMYTFKSLMETAESDLAAIVDTNMLGVLICCRCAPESLQIVQRLNL
jgi:chlorophyll(ide) b reductase